MLATEYNILITLMFFLYIFENQFIFMHIINFFGLMSILNHEFLFNFVHNYLVNPYYLNDTFNINNLDLDDGKIELLSEINFSDKSQTTDDSEETSDYYEDESDESD